MAESNRTPSVPADDQPSPEAVNGITGVPDGPGPRDVPDDKVIESTLPTAPVRRDDAPS